MRKSKLKLKDGKRVRVIETHTVKRRGGGIYLSLPRSQTFSTECLNFEHTSWHDTAAPVRVRDMEGHGCGHSRSLLSDP